MPSYNYGSLAKKPDRQEQNLPLHSHKHTKMKLSGKKIQVNNQLRVRCFILAVLVLSMCLFTAFFSGIAAQKGYELVKMKQSVTSLQKENARLKLDIAKLKTPERIKTIAVKQLGMVLPPKIYFANQNH